MAKEINPENEKQMKAEKIVAIIHGADKQKYTITDKHPLVASKDGKDKRAKSGDEHEAHPILVEKWAKNGWVKAGEKMPPNKMPVPPEKQ